VCGDQREEASPPNPVQKERAQKEDKSKAPGWSGYSFQLRSIIETWGSKEENCIGRYIRKNQWSQTETGKTLKRWSVEEEHWKGDEVKKKMRNTRQQNNP